MDGIRSIVVADLEDVGDSVLLAGDRRSIRSVLVHDNIPEVLQAVHCMQCKGCLAVYESIAALCAAPHLTQLVPPSCSELPIVVLAREQRSGSPSGLLPPGFLHALRHLQLSSLGVGARAALAQLLMPQQYVAAAEQRPRRICTMVNGDAPYFLLESISMLGVCHRMKGAYGDPLMLNNAEARRPESHYMPSHCSRSSEGEQASRDYPCGAANAERDGEQRGFRLHEAHTSPERRIAELEAILSHMHEGLVLTDPEGKLFSWNKRALEIHGFTEPEAAERTLEELVDVFEVRSFPDGDELASDQWPVARAMRGERFSGVKYRVTRRDTGLSRILSFNGSAFRNAHGELQLAILTFRDETERVAAEQRLRLLERWLEVSNEGVFVTDPNLTGNPIVYANTAFESITGYSRHEVVGRSWSILHGQGSDPEEVARVQNGFARREPCVAEFLSYRKDGTSYWSRLSLTPIYDDFGHLAHFVGVQSDVTRLKYLEQKYRQAQKMEAVGQLAGGVAHDFNNLVTVINGYSEILVKLLVGNQEALHLLDEVQRAGHQAASLTRQLLTFSRREVANPQVVDLNEAVKGVESMLGRLLDEDIVLTATTASNLWATKVDPGLMEQVILNLVLNARDAIAAGGEIRISTSNVVVDEANLGAALTKPGRYVALSVSDTGCGIAEQDKPRLFEPFFTTKPRGKGTGLGLPVVHAVVTQAGGGVEVVSAVGKGSCFSVFLPAVEEPIVAVESEVVEVATAKHFTVLIVEDQPAVRRLLREVLSEYGATVLEAERGDEALLCAETHQGDIDLLITDVVMPGMSGSKLAQELAIIRPDTIVLFTSGYTDDEVMRRGISGQQVNYLQKPFTPAMLMAKVATVLEAGSHITCRT